MLRLVDWQRVTPFDSGAVPFESGSAKASALMHKHFTIKQICKALDGRHRFAETNRIRQESLVNPPMCPYASLYLVNPLQE